MKYKIKNKFIFFIFACIQSCKDGAIIYNVYSHSLKLYYFLERITTLSLIQNLHY